MIEQKIKGKKLRSNDWYGLIIESMGCFILFFLLITVPGPEYFVRDPDGGHQLTGAMQILHGKHPFIDFRSTYGPLTFYASALGQILSGNRLIGEIALIIVGYWTAYLLLFKLFYEVSKKVSISVICLSFALILIPRFYKYYLVLGPILTLYSAWRYIENKSTKTLICMGFAIAFTGLYRFDFGVYTVICGLSTIFVINYIRDNSEILKAIGVLLLSMLVFAAPWLLWVWYKGGMLNYLGDTLSGIIHQGEGLSLPFPRFRFNESVTSNTNITFGLYVFFNIIPITSLATLYVLRDKLKENEKYKLFVGIVLEQLTLIQATHRSDFGHLLQPIPIGFVLIAWMVHVVTHNYFKTSWKPRTISIAFLILFAIMGGASVALCWNYGMLPQKNIFDAYANIKCLTGNNDEIVATIKAEYPGNEYVQAIEYIKNHTRSDESILAIPFLTSFYYFTWRTFGGGQMLLAPGYFSSKDDQLLMVERLREDNVVLIVEIPDASYDGLESRTIRKFASVVNKYVNDNYTEVNRIGEFVLKANNVRNTSASTHLPESKPCHD